MASQTILLFNPGEAVRKDIEPSSPAEDRTVPFTYSPLDSCRGGKQKTSSRVRDAQKRHTKKITGK
jgi:hypothetical protein